MPTPFRFHIPVETYEKALPNGRLSKRIGGVITTPTKDRQDERVLADGLDFSEFERAGWFNDNHGQSAADVVAYPDVAVKKIKKGQELPTGKRAPADGWWAEGVLVGSKGREVYKIAKDLEGTSRSYGFSIEGSILERDPLDTHTIARARVRNVAVTHCPVNTQTELVLLTKALFAGNAIGNPGASPGQGFAIRTESLDPELKVLTFGAKLFETKKKKKKKRKKCRYLSESDGAATLKSLFPRLLDEQARALYQFARRLKAAGVVG